MLCLWRVRGLAAVLFVFLSRRESRAKVSVMVSRPGGEIVSETQQVQHTKLLETVTEHFPSTFLDSGIGHCPSCLSFCPRSAQLRADTVLRPSGEILC